MESGLTIGSIAKELSLPGSFVSRWGKACTIAY
jgi:hypothetical protein